MTTGNVRPADMERITTSALAQKFIDKYCPFEQNDENISLDLDGKFYFKDDNDSSEFTNNAKDYL